MGKKSLLIDKLFVLVTTTKQAIELLKFIHEQALTGLSINAALKIANKDRKTVDRFRNIYYLHILDNAKLEKVTHIYILF